MQVSLASGACVVAGSATSPVIPLTPVASGWQITPRNKAADRFVLASRAIRHRSVFRGGEHDKTPYRNVWPWFGGTSDCCCGAWRTTDDDSKRDAAVRCHTALGSGCRQRGASSLHTGQRKMSMAISAGLCCDTLLLSPSHLPSMGLQKEEILSARCFSRVGTPGNGRRPTRPNTISAIRWPRTSFRRRPEPRHRAAMVCGLWKVGLHRTLRTSPRAQADTCRGPVPPPPRRPRGACTG